MPVAFLKTVYILYIFTRVAGGSATQSQEYFSQNACNTAKQLISQAWTERSKLPHSTMPDIEMMTCVPKNP